MICQRQEGTVANGEDPEQVPEEPFTEAPLSEDEALVAAPPSRSPGADGRLRAEDILGFPPCGQLEAPLQRAYNHSNGCAACRGRGGWHHVALDMPNGPRYLLGECVFISPCGKVRGNLPYVSAHIKFQQCVECAEAGGLGRATFLSATVPEPQQEGEGPTFAGGLSGPRGVVLNGHSGLPATIFVVERMEFPVVPLAVIFERDRQMGYRGTFNDFVVEMMLDCIEHHLGYDILVAEGAKDG